MGKFELQDISDGMELLANKLGFIAEIMDHLIGEASNELARQGYELQRIAQGKGDAE